MKKEWYISVYEDKAYLRNLTLLRKPFPDVHGIHDHCEVCWDRFSNHDEDKHVGYYNAKYRCWICEECFSQLKNLFEWKGETSDEKN